ncbi:MAG: hypothetical protein AVDCRST_MAG59-3714 [uncultured Thermomicrobiales bacterium]|uniref:Uncharacterized protein n=1 Tax=uncultured Thermomicrobiales bacterium TaxID=1645740 RepID=A0A6J4V9L2_9BACT|nr:MAG: hypothetical protein AVDCRST_MAG59-3714 [uncultured Thermomicrobiales bacterium]
MHAPGRAAGRIPRAAPAWTNLRPLSAVSFAIRTIGLPTPSSRPAPSS